MKHSLFLACVFVAAGPALALELSIRPDDEANQVVFLSKAPMESFEGKTHRVRGTVHIDLDRLTEGFHAEVSVDMASLDTGIELRNRHMRENHLHTDRYPEATFRATELLDPSTPALPVGGTVSFRVRGEFELHGVTRPLEVELQATRLEPGRVRVTGQFDVKLSDYDIPRPKFLFMKLGETQRVTLDLVAGTGGEE